MEEQHTQKLYRIGPFARYMGVTPDLLKHYEHFHLVEPVPSESGYRYYPFVQSSRLLNVLTLQGYGFSLREISDLLGNAGPEELLQALNAQGKNLERQLLFLQAVLEEQGRLSAGIERMAGREWDCREEELGPFCFLPHTYRRDFLPDPRIYEILKDWTGWMPVVKSCLEIPASLEILPPREQGEFFWGLILPLNLAEKYGIPLNAAVTQIPRRKWLVCDYLFPRLPSTSEHPP